MLCDLRRGDVVRLWEVIRLIERQCDSKTQFLKISIQTNDLLVKAGSTRSVVTLGMLLCSIVLSKSGLVDNLLNYDPR